MLDTLVIGAGAAGLAATRTLAASGQRVLVLEARDRLGGRAWTSADFAPFPVELGAEFIHGEQTVTVDLVRQAGLTLLPAPRYAALRWSAGGAALPLAQCSAQTRATVAALRQHYHALAEHPPVPDRSLADDLRAAGFDAAALQIADVLLAQTCCASIETLSCADIRRELLADRAGAQEFRIAEGYAALFDWLARGVDVRRSTAARVVQRGADGVTVQTTAGAFRARRCIVTVPPPLLQAGALRFDPPLPAETTAAIAAFVTEPATKLLYQFAAPQWDADLVFMAHTGLAARWWTSGYGRPGAALISAYITADRARELDALPEALALQRGLEELGHLLGAPNLAQHCLAQRRIAWAADPLARGGYAHLPPGAAAAREALAAPVDDLLWFAGEAAAYWTNPQTVHGAIESGIRAAQQAAAAGYAR